MTGWLVGWERGGRLGVGGLVIGVGEGLAFVEDWE